jgi:hypothetical protein
MGLSIAHNAMAQSVNNMNVDLWTPSGSPPPFDWYEPTDWQSNNATTEFISATVSKSSTAQSGPYSAQIRTINVFGNNTAGILTNGNATLDYAGYSVFTKTAGTPYTAKPTSLDGYYKYTVTTSPDTAMVICLLKKWNASTSQADTIGIGTLKLLPAASFQAFSCTVNYPSSATPDSIAIFIYSSIPASAQNGSILLVDNLSLAGVTGIEQPVESMPEVNVYPSPVSAGGMVRFNVDPAKPFGVCIFDAQGQLVMEKSAVVSAREFMLDLPAGLYTYRLTDEGHKLIGSGRLVVD